jgi:hypothetical protein
MSRPGRRILSAWMIVGLAVGVLVAPVRAGAVTANSGCGSTIGPALPGLDPGALQGPLDQIVAAGRPAPPR